MESLNVALRFIAVLWGMFSVAYSLRFIHGVFFGPAAAGLPRTPHEPPRWMRFPIELLVLACLVVGILPAITIGPILDVGVRALLGAEAPATASGYGTASPRRCDESRSRSPAARCSTCCCRAFSAAASTRFRSFPPVDGRRIFDRLLVALSWRWARGLDALLGTRRLQPQLRWAIAAALLAGLWPSGSTDCNGAATLLRDPSRARARMGGRRGVRLGAAWQAKFHRLVALILAGGAGLVVCLTFVWFSAPDLALTQLLVEIVTAVLLLLGLRWLPKRVPFVWTAAGARAALPRRVRDLAIAVASGAGLAAIAYAVMTRPLPDNPISRYFMERAYPEGGGTNVVNVILVDFRGFDTLGEIAVLGVVGARGVRALAPLPPRAGKHRTAAAAEGAERGERRRGPARPGDHHAPHVPRDGAPRGVSPAARPQPARRRLRRRAHARHRGDPAVHGGRHALGRIAARHPAGALDRRRAPARAAATGAGSLLFAHPFLTSHTAHLHLALFGELHVPSAFFFDLGVFSLVVGATGLVLIALAHQSIRD